jgi:hypothetical protein
MDRFHRSAFGAPDRSELRRSAGHFKRRATPPAAKSARPAVGQIGPPGVLRRLPDAASIALARRGPVWDSGRTNRFAPMKWVNIYDRWYYPCRSTVYAGRFNRSK